MANIPIHSRGHSVSVLGEIKQEVSVTMAIMVA